MKRGISGVIAGLMLSALLPLGVALPAAADAYCAPADSLEATQLPEQIRLDDCDLVGRTVTFEGLSATVPEPGYGTSKIAQTSTGEIALSVSTTPAGLVEIDAHTDEVAAPAPANRAPLGFSAAAAPDSDSFAAAIPVAVPTGFMPSEGEVYGIAETTFEPGEPSACDPAATGSVWYRVTRPDSLQRIKLQSGMNIMGVYTGRDVANLTRLACVAANNVPHHVTAPRGQAIFVQSLINPETFVSHFLLYSGEQRADGTLPCETRAHSLLEGAVARGRLKWRFNPADGSDNLSVRKMLRGVKRGVNVITASRNDCGMADRVSARAEYLGRTRKRATMCTTGRPDNVNTIAFGPAPPGMLGLACAWWTFEPDGTQKPLEADIRLSSGPTWTLTPDAPTCVDEIDLIGVVAHEVGHVFGLGHAEGVDGLNQTMAPSGSGCNAASRSLGRGDVIGLRKLY